MLLWKSNSRPLGIIDDVSAADLEAPSGTRSPAGHVSSFRLYRRAVPILPPRRDDWPAGRSRDEALCARGLPSVFERGHARNRSSFLPEAPSPTIACEAQEMKYNAPDPNSDILNALQVILSASQ
ncbi:hypothetical protein B0H11DRAFT_2263086 [Mycena galericulata]|nr:hypothetical protein B0H11DRAFT_2263086 [Mycena galericulata]